MADMCTETCEYVADESDPESWHGTESSIFYLDLPPEFGGLGVSKWHCPHPPLDQGDCNDDMDNQFCVFHTDPEDVPDHVDESEALLNSLSSAGSYLEKNRPEHRGQFVGATFGAIDLANEAVTATDKYDIRFDHARFQGDDEDLNFTQTEFIAKGENPITFARAEFITTGEGNVMFHGSTFRADGEGDVGFPNVTFRTDGDGEVRLSSSEFRTTGKGNVWFRGSTFWTTGTGSLGLRNATFRTEGEGDVVFLGSTFRTAGQGNVWFRGSTFQSINRGDVTFSDATFKADGEGDVTFSDATFKADGEGDVTFSDATFKADGGGDVAFSNGIIFNTDFQRVDFSETNFRGTDLIGADLREANLANIVINGETSCKRLDEGHSYDYPTRSLPFLVRLKRFYQKSTFSHESWDSTARAYHQLKITYSDHGLVGRARNMHVRERRARCLESKAANGRFNSRYLRSLFSQIFTGYGVQIWNLLSWMVILFVISTAIFITTGVEDTLTGNISFSVLAFTVAPPRIPEGLGLQIVMMVETFFGTLSIVLLGYILGNRERF
jgi:uncharacterized protein YjbI with pentapeptide repeats